MATNTETDTCWRMTTRRQARTRGGRCMDGIRTVYGKMGFSGGDVPARRKSMARQSWGL